MILGHRMYKTGTLSSERFEIDVLNFIEKAKEIGDPWNVCSAKQGKQQVKYLVKEQVQLGSIRVSQKEQEDTNLEDENWRIDEDDDECSVINHYSGSTHEVFKYKYHVIYSVSYAVPVLYFTACQSDGKLISLQNIWESVPDVYRTRLQHEKWTFLTQQEHPYLGIPFYQLHPCHTADFMKRALSIQKERDILRNVNYLVTWLSTVGPVVGLTISSEYCCMS